MRTPYVMRRRRFLYQGRSYALPLGIPIDALFVEARRNEGCIQGQFFYGGRKAQVAWSRAGRLLSERYFNRDGRAHGMEVSRFENGSIEWQVRWVSGQMHGLARQFSVKGRPLSRSRFQKGKGLDVWITNGELSELRELHGSVPHGVERWGDPSYPEEEGHYLNGKRAGIFRRWRGVHLEKGFPQYFVDGDEVSRAKYLRERLRNPKLPPDRRKDDSRTRPLHPGLKHVWVAPAIRKRAIRSSTGDPHQG